MPETLGSVTKSAFLKEVENHKLHQEFEVLAANTIEKGMPVKLDGATGNVLPLGAGDSEHLCIGVSIMQGDAGELVTVGMRAYAITWAQAETAVVAGPVEYFGYDAASGYNEYEDTGATAGTTVGWSLDNALADAVIRVAIKN